MITIGRKHGRVGLGSCSSCWTRPWRRGGSGCLGGTPACPAARIFRSLGLNSRRPQHSSSGQHPKSSAFSINSQVHDQIDVVGTYWQPQASNDMQTRYEWHVASGVPVSHQEPRTARGLRIQAAAADLRITGSGSRVTRRGWPRCSLPRESASQAVSLRDKPQGRSIARVRMQPPGRRSLDLWLF